MTKKNHSNDHREERYYHVLTYWPPIVTVWGPPILIRLLNCPSSVHNSRQISSGIASQIRVKDLVIFLRLARFFVYFCLVKTFIETPFSIVYSKIVDKTSTWNRIRLILYSYQRFDAQQVQIVFIKTNMSQTDIVLRFIYSQYYSATFRLKAKQIQ